ncbi:DUF2953 domain-containing protein [Paenibacillus sp. R14(2021)]|uniref:DUF2953 domain-containing protein n=1 Tax=Paenibacillus sp. R14(2021) TaxID=2859228 RepID=UPI001C61244E|nr:DUF2953 domain-containing protein [Paenibacillus sp. R14(2021)]
MLGYPFGWMIAAGLFFLLFLIIALSPVIIRGHVKRIGDDDDAELRIRALLGLVHYHWQMPVMKLKGMGMDLKHELTAENISDANKNSAMKHVNSKTIMQYLAWARTMLTQTDDLLGWVRTSLGHVHVTEWKWTSVVGTGDAMWTAMVTGMVWSVKTTAIGIISQLIRLDADPQLAVQPVYQEAHFSTEGQFTAKISVGYAVYAGLRLLLQIKRVPGAPSGFGGWQRILLRS